MTDNNIGKMCMYCPFCSSNEIVMWKRVKTPEEDRDTEVWGCYACKSQWFRERMDEDEARWIREVELGI